jgi:biopolymer transport protein ExbD
MNFSDDTLFEEEALDINITPLIDIVFLLLIFFMVSTTFVETSGIKVNLPAASSTAISTEEKSMEVSIRDDGKIFLAKREVSLNSLEETLKTFSAENPKAPLIVRADKETTHGLVVSVMDKARAAGVQRMAVATIPAK